MIYLYALTDRSIRREVGLSGLEDQPVHSTAYGELVAVHSQHEEQSFAATKENLWRHEQVAEEVMACADVLPFRFGTTYPSDEELRGLLSSHAGELQAGLQRVRGCVELGLRVLWHVDREPGAEERKPRQAESGREYMLARLAHERQSREQERRALSLATAIERPLIPLARERVNRVLPTPALLLTAAYLVPRNAVDSFRLQVQSLAQRYPDLQILCTGPWPPYHFSPRLAETEKQHA